MIVVYGTAGLIDLNVLLLDVETRNDTTMKRKREFYFRLLAARPEWAINNKRTEVDKLH